MLYPAYNEAISRIEYTMHTHRSRGFTLIELLVVIAIIGILSSVVLASLNTARSKGNDAAIQSNLATVQTQAELYYGSAAGNNSYGTQALATGATCYSTGAGVFSDTVIRKALSSAYVASGSVAANISCVAAGTKYAVAVKLSSDTNRYWCVDSTGGSSKSTTALTSSAVCPTSN